MYPWPVKIYSRGDFPRLRYVADQIFFNLLGVPYEIVTDKRKFGRNPVVNYSDEEISGAFKISPCGLLGETGIRPHEINVTEWKGIPVFFQTEKLSDLPFDVFSAVFYMLSRYEEYLDYKPDIHDRFPAASSLASKSGFLRRPVVNLWVKEMARSMIVRCPELVFRKNAFKALVTFDVDEPFKFRGKNILRNMKGFFLDFSKKYSDPVERYRTISKKQKDPWDIFDYMIEKTEESGAEIRVFIPTGDRSDYDRWPSWQNEDYSNLVICISGKIKTGLHPSYLSCNDLKRLKTEKERLEKLISSEVISSRYHYIRLKFPYSYVNLAEAGIKEDYSMGFPDESGFRAGIASPYFFYDLHSERTTNLLIFPFQVMDSTLLYYNKMKSGEAQCLIEELIDETRNVGGLFQSVWHNTILAESEEAIEWRAVFENTLKYQYR
ncbi:MAG: polysaccharide deacetylase family protein [Bacteroidales bacterium]